jgi:alcohol dehydrogenase class IV
MPVAVIADPELTVGVPPAITAWTGFDALAHCLEAYCAPGFHPMADGVALEGMRLMREWLPLAYRDGRNVEARANMMAAATMGATAFQKGLGAIHSLAHPVGAHFDAHHGLLNAILMPYVLEHNAPAIADRMAHLAVVLGLPGKGTEAVIGWVLALRAELQIPASLAGIVDEGFADEAARSGAVDPTAPTNPVPLTEASLREIFLRAVRGR